MNVATKQRILNIISRDGLLTLGSVMFCTMILIGEMARMRRGMSKVLNIIYLLIS